MSRKNKVGPVRIRIHVLDLCLEDARKALSNGEDCQIKHDDYIKRLEEYADSHDHVEPKKIRHRRSTSPCEVCGKRRADMEAHILHDHEGNASQPEPAKTYNGTR